MHEAYMDEDPQRHRYVHLWGASTRVCLCMSVYVNIPTRNWIDTGHTRDGRAATAVAASA